MLRFAAVLLICALCSAEHPAPGKVVDLTAENFESVSHLSKKFALNFLHGLLRMMLC
jgi:hypothetical protein